jgi:hypothetical protein
VDAQRVLRAASVIGVTFTGDALYAVLPRHLSVSAEESLKLLVRQMWLYEDPDSDQLYAFGHPHAQQVIYELTPSSERNHLYALIARHVEQLHGDDPAYFTALSHYYLHCDIEKALKYVAKVEAVLLSNAATMFDFAEAVDLLGKILVQCKNPQNAQVLAVLLDNCRSCIEQHAGEGSQGHRVGPSAIFRYFTSCLRHPTAVVPGSYEYLDAHKPRRVSALTAPEEEARVALLQVLDKHDLALREQVAEELAQRTAVVY